MCTNEYCHQMKHSYPALMLKVERDFSRRVHFVEKYTHSFIEPSNRRSVILNFANLSKAASYEPRAGH